MFSSLLKDHQKCQQEKKEAVDKKKNETLAAAAQLGSCLVDQLNEDIAKAYSNQRKIDVEIRQLQTNVTNFSKQHSQWLSLMESLNESVKELGDVENWSKSIENDLKLVGTALEYAHKVGRQQH